MPGLQVGDGDLADGGELGLAGVRAVGPIDQLGGFAVGDSCLIVIAPDDAGGFLLLGEAEFLLVELGMEKQVQSQGKYLVGVGFERIPRQGGGIGAAGGFDVGRLGFEQVVHGVAVHFGGAAGAPGLAVEVNQPGLGRILVARAAGDQHRSIDKRQFVIFLEEDHDAVLELNAFGLLRFELDAAGESGSSPRVSPAGLGR